LRSDGNAGFIFALVAFPLLERYIRNKSSCPEGESLKPQFFAELGQMFPEILGKESAFWDCYRNRYPDPGAAERDAHQQLPAG
jgi:hypothetical protein